MPIDTGAFVEPPVGRSGVDTNQQNITATRVGKVGHIEAKWVVTAAMPADVEAVKDDHRLPIGAVKFKRDTLALVGLIELKDTPVPTDTCLWIIAAQGVKSLACERRIVDEWQFNRPIVRQINRLPVTIVEGHRAGGQEISRLLKVPGPAAAISKIFARI